MRPLVTILLLFCLFIGVHCASVYPSDFSWGVATSAYQIEGAWDVDGRTPSIWDTFSQAGKCKGDTGNTACDHYNLWPKDIELIGNLSVGWYRFSLSWSRLIPNGEGVSNSDAVLYYEDIFMGLRNISIHPVVTLFHWDLPQVLQDKYNGWLNKSTIDAFVAYADFCFETFGQYVTRWITINEPFLVSWLGHGLGSHAPGRCSNRTICDAGDSETEPYIVAHNLLLAHAQVADLYHRKYQNKQKGKIGITLNSDFAFPLTLTTTDQATALRYMEFFLGWFADPIYLGNYPASMRSAIGANLPTFNATEINLLKTSNDFFGLNHYTSLYTTNYLNPISPDIVGWERSLNVNTTRIKGGTLIGPPSGSSWLYVVPQGFRSLLNWIKNRYNNPEIFVTENGVSVPNESMMPVADALNDTFRINYFASYLEQLELAISEDKVNVKGYFAWTLLDNFEWADGYTVRFGLHYVDFNTLERTPKESAIWYSNYILSQRPVPIPLDSQWWFVAFLLFPGFIILVLVTVCITYEYKSHNPEWKPLLGDNT